MDVTTKSHETVNGNAMICSMKKVINKYPDAPCIHVIFDQGPANKNKAVKEFAALNNIKLHYLPTYSPNLNPIERLWKVMNEHVRNNKFFSRPKEFRDAVSNFFNKTWPTISLSMSSRINDNFQTVNKPKNFKTAFSR
jgi:transposase